MAVKPELIYIGDPMCSWCWGIAPTIHHIASRDDLQLRTVVGGLRPGPGAEVLDDSMRRFLAHHWEKVAEVSGQPFDQTVLDREGWTYDTELPAIAVTTMRHLAESETIGFFTHLQQSFYADGIDITDPARYPALIDGFAVDEISFMDELRSDDGRNRAWGDFAEARELGVAGFPTILLQVNGATQVLSRGYASRAHFDDRLAYWVEGRQPDGASVGTCGIDGIC